MNRTGADPVPDPDDAPLTAEELAAVERQGRFLAWEAEMVNLARSAGEDGQAARSVTAEREAESLVATAKGLLTPAEVARLFRVSARTVLAWSKAGRLGSVRTLGGHRRYREAEIQALFDAGPASSAKHVGNENTGWF